MQNAINIWLCYPSCENCTLGAKYSSNQNHNCLKCKVNYYPFTNIENNCYNKEEGKIHQDWYFNKTLEIIEGFLLNNDPWIININDLIKICDSKKIKW